MPDTKILKTSSGWIDVDAPNTYHPVRRLAREARRAALKAQGKVFKPRVKPQASSSSSSSQIPLWTDLQLRALRRMTKELGVPPLDAEEVVTKFGYNASVSYAHMRAAGANHTEALSVINMLNPDISLAYGKARAAGQNHTEAMDVALHPPVSINVVYMP